MAAKTRTGGRKLSLITLKSLRSNLRKCPHCLPDEAIARSGAHLVEVELLDLKPVKDAIAALPNQTLEMRLLFSNGITSTWHLGGGTVSALKQLPTIRGN